MWVPYIAECVPIDTVVPTDGAGPDGGIARAGMAAMRIVGFPRSK
jgi:hypothetical protein